MGIAVAKKKMLLKSFRKLHLELTKTMFFLYVYILILFLPFLLE